MHLRNATVRNDTSPLLAGSSNSASTTHESYGASTHFSAEQSLQNNMRFGLLPSMHKLLSKIGELTTQDARLKAEGMSATQTQHLTTVAQTLKAVRDSTLADIANLVSKNTTGKSFSQKDLNVYAQTFADAKIKANPLLEAIHNHTDQYV